MLWGAHVYAVHHGSFGRNPDPHGSRNAFLGPQTKDDQNENTNEVFERMTDQWPRNSGSQTDGIEYLTGCALVASGLDINSDIRLTTKFGSTPQCRRAANEFLKADYRVFSPARQLLVLFASAPTPMRAENSVDEEFYHRFAPPLPSFAR